MSDAIDRAKARSADRDLERDNLTLSDNSEEVIREWEEDITYQPGQMVSYEDAVYRAVDEVMGESPDESECWEAIEDEDEGDEEEE